MLIAISCLVLSLICFSSSLYGNGESHVTQTHTDS